MVVKCGTPVPGWRWLRVGSVPFPPSREHLVCRVMHCHGGRKGAHSLPRLPLPYLLAVGRPRSDGKQSWCPPACSPPADKACSAGCAEKKGAASILLPSDWAG